MSGTYRPPNANGQVNRASTKLARRVLIAGALFLTINIILFLPPVQKKIEAGFFASMQASGALENDGIAVDENEQTVDETIRESLASCLIRVQQQDRQGCGVIWDINETEVILATAAHVAATPAESAEITFFNGRRADAEVLYTAENADLAFLRIPVSVLENFGWADYTYVRVGKRPYENGKEVPLTIEEELILFQGNTEVLRAVVLNPALYMEDFGETMIWAEATAVPGMSGGGVFDRFGNFMGILCGGNAQNEIAVLPVDTIQKEYEKRKGE